MCKTLFALENDICIAFAYIQPRNSVYYTLHEFGFFEIFEILEQDICTYSELGDVIITGDLHARCCNRPDILQSNLESNRYVPVPDVNVMVDDNFKYISQRFSMDETVSTSGIELFDLVLRYNIRKYPKMI